MARKKELEKLSRKELEKDLTPEQKTLLEDIRIGRIDPVYFAESILGIRLHDGQQLWLWMTTKTQLEKSYELGLTLRDEEYRKLWRNRDEFDELLHKNPDMLRNILVPSNRWGKTLVTSVKHLWFNFYKIGVRGNVEQKKEVRCGTLNLSPHSNQCQAAYDYVLDILNSRFVYTIKEKDGVIRSFKNECRIPNFYMSDNQQRRTIFFNNGTFFKTIPTGEDQASSLAGNPYLYISYDECAQSLHLKAELPAKIMSRLIDFGGPLDLVSTPEVDKPSHQYFFHIAKLGLKGDDGWFTLVGKISDNVFLGEKEVSQVIASIKSTDPTKYRQVAYGEFVTTGKKMFDATLIERLWNGFQPPQVMMDRKYIVWADWGFADTGDPTVFYVLDYTELYNWLQKRPDQRSALMPGYEVVYREAVRGGSPFAVLAQARILQRTWNGAIFGHDSASMGGVIIKKTLKEMEMQNMVDFSSAGGQKADMLFIMISVMSANRQIDVDPEGKVTEKNPNFGRLRSFYIPELEEQLGNYQYNPDKGVTDKRIEQDDVMALGMPLWYLERKIVRNSMKMIDFNPLAPTVDKIFSKVAAKTLSMHTLTIPEKRIF